MKGLFRRTKKEVRAVDTISFQIVPGEMVGFLGPNGAGKTTTLKMLSGLLFPTKGTAHVLGYTPHERNKDFLRQITLVTGQRNQLVWDIPARDSYELFKAVYDLTPTDFKRTVDEFVELLELEELITKPVRNLSLGERMKVEIAGSLLHRPRVLFLDEPTLGLDITMQRRIRRFFAEYNRREGATILLTSHYMADVVALCKRVIVIHQGHLLFDGDLSDLVRRFTGHKRIMVKPEDQSLDLSGYGEIMSRDSGVVSLRVPREEISKVTAKLLAEIPIIDLSVEDPPIEDVIETVFAEGDDAANA
ncbi:MAG TPA: ATP-binding cassette domain-containing protein [Anaerolineae bacterium]|nr:ATP-binding cassette domain-containing protein [Anaerolineae bacterium]